MATMCWLSIKIWIACGALSTNVTPCYAAFDAANIDALRQAGVDNFSTGLVIGSDLSNILAAVLLRRVGVNHVIAKARTRTQREILLQVGVDQVILPEHEAGVRLARRLAAGHFIDYLEVADDVGIVELIAPPSFWDRSLSECNLRQPRYGLTAIAVRRGE
ncbi:MAG: NAD-binding protein [Caldilineaceae bacterium]